MKYLVAVLVLLTAGFAFGQEPGSKIYIPQPAPNKTVADGTKLVTTTAPAFNLVLQAEIFKTRLPLQIVSDPKQADYTMQWAAIPEEERTNSTFSGVTQDERYTVSVSLLGKDSQVIWAGSVDKKNIHDCAVEIARQLKDEMKHKK